MRLCSLFTCFMFFFFKQKTAYEIGLGIPAEPLFRSMIGVSNLQSVNFCVMEAIKLCRLDTPIIFIEARINLSRFVVTGCAAKTSRSEERRVGKECRSRWSLCAEEKKTKIEVTAASRAR